MRTLKLFFVAAMLMLSTWTSAFARDQPQTLPLFGGPGGGNFNFECPERFEGAVIRRGAWITSLGLICSGKHLAMTGATSGPTEEYVCPGGGTVDSIRYGFTRDGNRPKYLDYLELHCSHGEVHCFHTGDGCWDRHPNPGSFNGAGLTNVSACGGGRHGYGFAGRSGAAIDALAMECTPLPANARPQCCFEIVKDNLGHPHRVRICDGSCPRT